MGGQRAAIAHHSRSRKEFQVVASGATRIWSHCRWRRQRHHKSGTNDFHGAAPFEYFRTEALPPPQSDGKTPIKNFRRNQFGGSFRCPLSRTKLFFFAQRRKAPAENLTPQESSSSSRSGQPAAVELRSRLCRGAVT